MNNVINPDLLKMQGKQKIMCRINTPILINDLLKKLKTESLEIPLTIFGRHMVELGKIGNRLNDTELNELLTRLHILEVE